MANRPTKHSGEHCHGCFMECEPYAHAWNGRAYPCSTELRIWAELHKEDPAGIVISERKEVW